MYYVKFYTASYFFWIGIIILVLGIISLFHPLAFLFILNRSIASIVVSGGILISFISLLFPVTMKKPSTYNQMIDSLLPDFAFSELHKVQIKASPEKVKMIMQNTGVKDIPAARMLMKIRGIADQDVDLSNRVSNCPWVQTLSQPLILISLWFHLTNGLPL